MAKSTAHAARIVAAVGATGSGKSSWLKSELARTRPARLLIVDPDDEYGEHARRVLSLRELARVTAAPTFAVRYVTAASRELGERQFGFACACAWAALQRGPVTFVVEELPDFTRPDRAPEPWARLLRRGRKYGAVIYAAAQRPAMVDKTLWSQATHLRCGWLAYADDQRVMAAALGCAPADLAALRPLDYVERDRNSAAGLRRGRLGAAEARPAGRKSVDRRRAAR